MIIDCDACVVRGPACGNCVVSVLLGAPPADRAGEDESGIDLDGNEQAAIAVLAGSGLVPPLRLVAAASARRGGPVRVTDQENDATSGEGQRAAI